ncbi:MAG: hypothetical protein M3209_10755 [Acidobacteriota bacterium]|nr:hypothetical protein [Acidobacteriota bacterium]
MKSALKFLIAFIIAASCAAVCYAQNDKQNLVQFGEVQCDSEMAKLDSIADKLNSDSKLNAYVIVYAGQKDTKRNEVQVRGARMRRYLVDIRGISSSRIKVVAGGFREKFTVEVWFVLQDESEPEPTPTVKEKKVRFRKGLMDTWEEPGCFPDRKPIPFVNASK